MRGETRVKATILAVILLGAAQGIFADQLIRANGEVLDGTFAGFDKHQLIFKKTAGGEARDFAANVKSLTVVECPTVSVELLNKRYDSVVFKGYDKYTAYLEDNSGAIRAPATMLKSITILERPSVKEGPAPEPEVEPPPGPAQQIARTVPGATTVGAPAPRAPGAGREWKPTGKWREIESPDVPVISRGEDVDVESKLRKGVVNVVHFHYAAAHSSVRQGNYIEVLARKSGGRIVVLRIVVQGWDAPVCGAKEIKALPQFWFYSRSGKLVNKLTDRFTEGDIDAAMKQALQQL
jgi:hypothetical protein